MTTTNTSFEHVLHNLQERDRIIETMKTIMDALFIRIKESDNCSAILIASLNMIQDKVDSNFIEYNHTMERFNLGIISFISDYYAVIEQHSDQFHSRYLHTYSGHLGHYSPILPEEPTNSKFDIAELVTIFTDHCYELKHFKFHTDSSHVRRARERTWIIYQKLSNYIASENVYDLSDLIVHEFDSIVMGIARMFDIDAIRPSVRKNKLPKAKLDEEGLELFNKLRYMIQQFHNIKLDFKPSEEMLDYCECGNLMEVISGSSELLCNNCGYLYELKGTVFSDEQFYSQDGTRYKHAGYEPSKHCKVWLERIQAKETNTITDSQINKIDACIRRDGITNKKRLTIEQLRRYLKDTGLTELNEHVALIKRVITGVAPPQLSYAETQDITNSFSKAVKAYNLIRPSNKSNMLFYPFIIAKLIEQHVDNYNKRKGLLSFIHLQGPQTLIQNDQIWAQICKTIPGFRYHPTDRYEYMD